jgi:hypothetical protein
MSRGVLRAAAELVAIAEQGCVLAAEGRLDDLEAQQEAWDRAVALLGPLTALPEEAKPLVRRAAELQGEQAAILVAAQAEIGAELGRLRTTRRGAQGYANAGMPARGSTLSASA